MTRAEALDKAVARYRAASADLDRLTQLVFPYGLAVTLPDGRQGTVAGVGQGTERPRVAVKLPKADGSGTGWLHCFPAVEDLLAANPHLGLEYDTP